MATRLQRQAMAWSEAKMFIRRLREVQDRLDVKQQRALQAQALSGDIVGAFKELDRLIREKER